MTLRRFMVIAILLMFSIPAFSQRGGGGGGGGEGGQGGGRGGRGGRGGNGGPNNQGPRGGGRGGRGQIAGLGGLSPLRSSSANPLTPEKVARGRELFFDKRLSADGTVACASCHDPFLAF